jgi:hypothetical protein
MKTPIGRRLGIAPAPVYPAPKPVIAPGVLPAAMNAPALSAPVTQQPPTAPGMLPTTEATPLYDATTPVATAAPAEAGGWQGALQRALIGFNKGASRVPLDPTYNPVGAGLIAGASTIGAEQESAVNRRAAAQAAAQKPFADAQAAAVKTSAEEQAREPFERRKNQDIYNRTLAEQEAKLKRETAPEAIESLAQHIATLPPSLRRVEIGKQAGPVAMALATRVDAIRNSDPRMKAALDVERQATAGLTDAELEKRYQNELAGGKAEAAGIGTVKGAEGQRIGAVSASMEDMLAKAKPLIASISPTASKTFNGLYQAGNREFNDPDLAKVDTYLTSAAGFYASLQKNGGVPDTVEREAAKKILSARLDSGGFAAVESALRDEANSRVLRIKETQSKTGPGSAVPTSHAPKAGGFDWRKH